MPAGVPRGGPLGGLLGEPSSGTQRGLGNSLWAALPARRGSASSKPVAGPQGYYPHKVMPSAALGGHAHGITAFLGSGTQSFQNHRMDAMCHLYDLRQQLRRQTTKRRRGHQRTQRTQQRNPSPGVFLSRQRLQQTRMRCHR